MLCTGRQIRIAAPETKVAKLAVSADDVPNHHPTLTINQPAGRLRNKILIKGGANGPAVGETELMDDCACSSTGPTDAEEGKNAE